MSVIFRLTNTKEAVFIKYNLECYLYYLFNASNKTFISFEEYLMVQMKEAMDQKLLKFNDVLKIIETYEKFVTSPILIKHVFEMDPYNIARAQNGKKSIYYDLIEDSYTYFSKALKCHLKNNSDKDLEINNYERDTFNLASKIEGISDSDTTTKVLEEYLEVIAKLRYEKKITPINIYLLNETDEMIQKYIDINKKTNKNNYNFYTEEQKEIKRFNEVNKNFIDWLFHCYFESNRIDLYFPERKKTYRKVKTI